MKGKKKEKKKSRYIPKAWKEEIIKKQRGYCASKTCAKDNETTKKKKITLYSNFDHKKPLAMGGKNKKSNIQALCPLCHMKKTRADREKIKEWKEKQKDKPKKSDKPKKKVKLY